MFWKINLKVFSGFGSGNGSPHVFEVVSGTVARSFPIRSLSTPCVRTEDRSGLVTVASGPVRVAGYSRRIQGGWVGSPWSRIQLKVSRA
jgi:hypothetical protein